MTRRTRAFYQVNDGWREKVEREMTERGLKRKALADAVGVDKSAITVLLRRSTAKNRGPETSTIAKAVADYLRIPLPGQIDEDAEFVLPHLRAIRERNPEAYKGIIASIMATSPLDSVKKPPEKK